MLYCSDWHTPWYHMIAVIVCTNQDKRGPQEDQEKPDEDEGQSATNVPAPPPPVSGSETLGEYVSIVLELLQRGRGRGREGERGGRKRNSGAVLDGIPPHDHQVLGQ